MSIFKRKRKKKKLRNLFSRGNYTKPTCGFGENHFAYLWLKKYYLTHLWYIPFVFRNPSLLKAGVNRYFCSSFMSRSSQNKKKIAQKWKKNKIKNWYLSLSPFTQILNMKNILKKIKPKSWRTYPKKLSLGPTLENYRPLYPDSASGNTLNEYKAFPLASKLLQEDLYPSVVQFAKVQAKFMLSTSLLRSLAFGSNTHHLLGRYSIFCVGTRNLFWLYQKHLSHILTAHHTYKFPNDVQNFPKQRSLHPHL